MSIRGAHGPHAAGKLDRALPVARGFDDLSEAAWVEACAADKRAVDVWLAH